MASLSQKPPHNSHEKIAPGAKDVLAHRWAGVWIDGNRSWPEFTLPTLAKRHRALENPTASGELGRPQPHQPGDRSYGQFGSRKSGARTLIGRGRANCVSVPISHCKNARVPPNALGRATASGELGRPRPHQLGGRYCASFEIECQARCSIPPPGERSTQYRHNDLSVAL